ncbi:MAG: MoaD/ThiS family protein [Nitrospinota bacterium]|nr:MoaD/ThiS family protein [Nitrospinota bacterium]MDH5679356.1 MoaD/ThiS family protein [Nitrospinota bacterium]MDH5755866.1 MoaD/ThiS family protein [Nitrospinota bacterium]
MASVKVRIPTPLQRLTKGESEIAGTGETIKEVIAGLEANFPGFSERLYDEEGKLRRFINIYVNEEDIRFLDGENTKLSDGDDISVIPAIAGGRG